LTARKQQVSLQFMKSCDKSYDDDNNNNNNNNNNNIDDVYKK